MPSPQFGTDQSIFLLSPLKVVPYRSNMFCITSLVISLKALIFTSENGTIISARPTALDATREVTAKYKNVPPMSKSGRPTEQPIDVIKAEKEFGISFFKDFSQILIQNGQYHMVFEARFQGHPHEINLVSCPQIICAHSLSEEDRTALQYKVEGIKGQIPEPVWRELNERYNIRRKDWLVISKET
ncbi:uncharacterized protein BO80DRAFT_489071 [Aspergillus ibericus CBS 121593]|uniref:Uncharacterized protein n=1 Tax=Aspergillus ibericus CBS 121593 TaxID=1448316 RepID=A0A395GJM2_9EURO|nr:hypothetical protein BO80DRAFT_489071 [Aspergillus ibericus CBS 121593]RAK94957.1 hypothetical protein BO80DRAFT_489071 [Aspergillus ibericus CBS 121593]